jgi:hypothetical protein
VTRKKSSRKELRTTIKELRAKLDRADRTAHRLKSKAARLQKANTELEAKVRDLKKSNKRLKKTHLPPDTPAATSPALGPAVGPDDSWTVAQLRAEARTRGLAGLSRKTKAELLAALG